VYLVKKVKGPVYSCQRNSISQWRSVTCRMGSHSVICHPKWPNKVNTPRFNISQRGWSGTQFTYSAGMDNRVRSAFGADVSSRIRALDQSINQSI